MSILIDCEENFKTFAEMDEVMKLKESFSSILNALQKSKNALRILRLAQA